MDMLNRVATGIAACVTLCTGVSLLKDGTRVTVNEKEVDNVLVVGTGAFLTAVGATVILKQLVDIATSSK